MVLFQTAVLRISLLLPCVMRIEQDAFTDLPTQIIQNRTFSPTVHTLATEGDILTITTEDAIFRVNTVSGEMESITLSDGTTHRDFTSGILPGTARTLDQANGAVKLEKGIASRSGVSMLDDSKSLLLSEGRILPRPKCRDRYYFACGRDYRKQLQTFFSLTGPVPLIPKFALGNWWSRYRAYTQEEYRRLMQEFIRRKIPVTVATIDMDWHWTDVVQRFGREAKPEKPKTKEELLYNTVLPGWTGYTWNTELFPDHRELLNWLHDQGFKVPLNVHPSQGIRFFEERYEAMCLRMGLNPAEKKCVPFDPADPKFMAAYFEEIHHPLEADGVDFWWLDWQQGQVSNIPGLDPLWALNHYHTLDAARNGKRPLILSRYAGLGSHRYPLGFSGDTCVTWESLHFQPYFTNCAANAGYTWWSHDIGGHMRGIQDDELYLRWVQYGVFSPVNRLHSTNSEFMGKEPWKRSWAVDTIATEFLRLRHKLIPYLYSANYLTHTEAEPICAPVYYHHDCEDAYAAKNEYFFGSQLLVSPVTRPADRKLNLAWADTWLPEGRWTDIFTGRVYRGGRWIRMHRDWNAIPVLAREGAIVPMYRNAETNTLSLDQPLEIHLWRGNGSFTLYEDDGETMAFETGVFAKTRFTLEEEGSRLRLTITPPADSHGLLPNERQLYLKFRDVETDEKCITLGSSPVVVELTDVRPLENPPVSELRSALLTRLQGSNDWKNTLLKRKYPACLRDALKELDALWYE